jgi:hypothetical protein
VNGVLLLVFTLAFGFSGYLLPWNQMSYWATTAARTPSPPYRRRRNDPALRARRGVIG